MRDEPLSIHYVFDDGNTDWQEIARVPAGEAWSIDFGLLSNRSGGILTSFYLIAMRPPQPAGTVVPDDATTNATYLWAEASAASEAIKEKTWGSTSTPGRIWFMAGTCLAAQVSTSDDVGLILSGSRWRA